jgi:hypothetical protein
LKTGLRPGSLLLVGVALLAITLFSSRASADRPTKFRTPEGHLVTVRGGCLLVQARAGVDLAPRDDSWCDAFVAPSGSLATTYSWFPDFIVAAFDNAERTRCPGGALNCIVRGRDVQIALVSDGIPNAVVGHDQADRNLSVRVSTGLVDFTDAAAISYIDEAKSQQKGFGPTGGLTDWITQMDALGGRPCVMHAPTPLRQLNKDEFVVVRTFAQAFYEFVMNHELAHVASANADCGAHNPTAMEREVACDADAFDKLTAAVPQRALPPAVAAPLVAIAHYEHILNERFGRLVAPAAGKSFLDLYPASNWTARARAYVTLWENHCNTAAADQTTCRNGWRAAIADVRRLLAIPMPAQCSDTNTPAAENAPATFENGLEQLVAAAPDQFVSIRGQAEPRDPDADASFYSLTVAVPGLRDCALMVDDDATRAPTVTCSAYRGSENAQANAAYRDLAAKVRTFARAKGQTAGEDKDSATNGMSDGIQTAYEAVNGVRVRARYDVSSSKRGTVLGVHLWVDAPRKR